MILFQHTNYLHKSLVHLNFNMFTAVMFFFLQDPKYVEGMMNVDWLGFMQPGSFLQLKLIIFQSCPTKQVVFLP